MAGGRYTASVLAKLDQSGINELWEEISDSDDDETELAETEHQCGIDEVSDWVPAARIRTDRLDLHSDRLHLLKPVNTVKAASPTF